MGCFKTCRKWTVLTFNLIFLVMSITLITTGSISIHNLNNLSQAIPFAYQGLKSFPISLVVLGSIVLLVSLLGTYGVFKKHICLLNTYTIILLVIFLVHVFTSISIFMAVTRQKTLVVKVNSTVDDIFENYKENKPLIELMQAKLTCCGPDGPQFWDKIADKNETVVCTGKEYNTGCRTALYDFLMHSVDYAGILVLAFIPVLVFGATLSLSLVNSIRSDIHQYGKYNV